MKRKIFLILFLSMFFILGSSTVSYCSTVDDLISIGSQYNYWHIYNSGQYTYIVYYDEPFIANDINSNGYYRYNSDGAPILFGMHKLVNGSISQHSSYQVYQDRSFLFGSTSTFVASNYDIKDSDGNLIFKATHIDLDEEDEPTSAPNYNIPSSIIDIPSFTEMYDLLKDTYPYYIITVDVENSDEIAYSIYFSKTNKFSSYGSEWYQGYSLKDCVRYTYNSNVDDNWVIDKTYTTPCNIGHADSSLPTNYRRILFSSEDYYYDDKVVFQKAPILPTQVMKMGRLLAYLMPLMKYLIPCLMALLISAIAFRKAWTFLKMQLIR